MQKKEKCFASTTNTVAIAVWLSASVDTEGTI
jgi:hypothetical protein